MNHLIYNPDLETKTNSESTIIVATHPKFTDITENVISSEFSSPEFNSLENFSPEYSSQNINNNYSKDIGYLAAPEIISDDASFSQVTSPQEKLEFRDKKPIVAVKAIKNSSFVESDRKLEATINTAVPETENKPSFSNKAIEIKAKMTSDFKLLKVGIKLSGSNAIVSILVNVKQDNSQDINLGEWLLPYNEVIKILKLNVTNLTDGKFKLIAPGFVTYVDQKQIRKDSQLGLVFSITDLQKLFNINAKFDNKNNIIVLEVPWLKQEKKETSQTNKNYTIPPRYVPKNSVNTFTTTIPLNNRSINHLTKSEITSGLSFGDTQNTTFDVNAIFPLNSQITESLTKNNIFTVEQTGDYLQLETVRKTNQSIINIKEPKP